MSCEQWAGIGMAVAFLFGWFLSSFSGTMIQVRNFKRVTGDAWQKGYHEGYDKGYERGRKDRFSS